MCLGALFSLNKNYFNSSIISPYLNTPPLHQFIIRVEIIVCSETPFSKSSCRIENSQLICNQLTGFYMIRYKFFHKNISEQTIVNLFPNYYAQCKRNILNSCYTLTNISFNTFNLNKDLIKSFIQCTVSNIVKTGSDKIKEMYFCFFFLFN